jgi:hypothetical protein
MRTERQKAAVALRVPADYAKQLLSGLYFSRWREHAVQSSQDLFGDTHEADVTTLGFTTQFDPVPWTIDPAGTGTQCS